MVIKCVLCKEKIDSEYGKLKGTFVKARDVDGKNKLISVCSMCMKKDKWIENAKIEGA